LVPVLRLAQRAGLHAAVARLVRLPEAAGSAGANPVAKVGSIVAGMVAGADSIEDMDVVRQDGLSRLFGGIRAPSTLGTFLRGFPWGNVRQLDAVARQTLTELARQAPVLAGAGQYAFLDVDSTIEQVYGYQKQGADYGYTRVRGLHPLLATVSTPIAAPPSYEELAALVSVLSVRLTEQAKLIEAMRVELAALRRAVGRDSSNSSVPPSQDGPALKAKAKAGRGSAESTDASGADRRDGPAERGTVKRRQGGQPGQRPGAGGPPGPDRAGGAGRVWGLRRVAVRGGWEARGQRAGV
jgi:Family of unknown function (DUF6444)